MRYSKLLALVGLVIAVGVPARPALAQHKHVVGYSATTSTREAAAEFAMSDGSALRIALRNGDLLIDGARVAQYQPGGALDARWRAVLAWSGAVTTDEALAVLQHWKAGELTGADANAYGILRDRLAGLTPAEVVPVPPEPPAQDVEQALAQAHEAIAAAGAEARVAAEQARAIRERIRLHEPVRVRVTSRAVAPGPFGGAVNGLFGLLGAFVALCAMAFGASFFAGRQIDVLADTVHTSFARSFFVGLFAQPLILPAFGAMIVGLALTVVGILVIPVAIAAFVMALLAALVGGYLAVARVAGSTLMKRRRGDHGTDGLGILRSVAYGLAITMAVWLPAAVFGWVPVAGTILTWTAGVATWALATTGFGAALLTRGGVRTTFGRHFAPPELPPATLFEQPGPEISTAEWLARGRR